jgi:phosphoribosylformylglycinamidine cyclo-ligase
MSSDNSQRYNLRGVSASKEDVHNAIKNIDKGLFPKAFCKIVPDYLTQDHACRRSRHQVVFGLYVLERNG